MTDSRYFRAAVWLLLIFTIVWVASHISFIFIPVGILLQTVFFPLLIAGVLYYLTVPVVDLLTSYKTPRTVAILIVYLVIVAAVSVVVALLGPVFQRQIMSLMDNTPALFSEFRLWALEAQQSTILSNFVSAEQMTFAEVAKRLSEYVNQLFFAVVNNISSFIGTLTSFFTIMLMIPFILFYMLKSGSELSETIVQFLPAQHRDEGQTILVEMNGALKAFIQGQLIVSLSVGVLCYVGFLVIGIEYALLLALLAMVTNVIPFVGPFIGTIPALIVAILTSPLMIVKVLIVIIVVQQTESLLISPRVMGSKLHIHPVTIILLILVGGKLAGFLGLILAIPTYAIVKVFSTYTWRLIKLKTNWESS